MSRLPALLSWILLACAAPAAAQTAIHRCIGANGGAVFTDQPCAALDATPIAPAARSEASQAATLPPPILCAGSPEILRQSVIDAFAGRDVNRLAGLMLWRGYGRGAAIADIRSLADLVRQPLLDVGLPGELSGNDPATASTAFDDRFALDRPAAPPPNRDELILQLAGNDGSGEPRERRFGIVRQAGCLWLRNAD